jgi:hypothetical protein
VVSLSELLEGGDSFKGFVYGGEGKRGDRKTLAELMTGETEHVPITVHVVADFDSKDGQALLKEILKSMVCFWPSTPWFRV